MAIPFHVDEEYVRSFVVFSAALGDNAQTILQKLHILFGKEAPKKTFVYKWMRAIEDGVTFFEDAKRSGRPCENVGLEPMIREILADEPFSSTRSLAEDLGKPRETIRVILITRMGLRKFKCRWIPHALTDDQKKMRVSCALAMLSRLTVRDGIKNTITGDESWFYLEIPATGQWADSPENVQKNVQKNIASKKVMITILWSVQGFLVIDALPTGGKFTSLYFRTILNKLSRHMSIKKPVKGLQGLNLHLDNAAPHRAQSTQQHIRRLGLKNLPHPPYSPDLAPSDFFLFGHVKEKLKGQKFPNEKALLQAIQNVLGEIPKATLIRVMDEWLRRLQAVIDTGGEYILE
jgi:histone-lysine N-methyltransferase SETMAR